MLEVLINFAKSTGIYDFIEDPVLAGKTLLMYVIIGVLIYLAIGKKYDQERTLKALGLGKIGRSVDQVDNPCVRGMIFKVKHLVEVEEIKAK